MAVTRNNFYVPDGIKFGDDTVQLSAYSSANVIDLLKSGNSLVQINTANTITGTYISATSNIAAPGGAGSNTQLLLNITGNIASTSDLAFDTATGVLSTGNISTAGNVSAGGNVSAAYLNGNGIAITNIYGPNVSGTVPQANIVTDATQTAITRVGNLTGLSSTGTITTTGLISAGGNVESANLVTTGIANIVGSAYIGGTANITGDANIGGGANITGIGNIGSIETTSITATGTVTVADLVISGGGIINGDGGGLSNIQWANTTDGTHTGGDALTQYFLSSGNVTSIVADTVTANTLSGEGGNISNVQWASVTGRIAGVQAYLADVGGNNIGNIGTLGFGTGNISITGNTINGSAGTDPLIIDPDGDGSPLTGNLVVLGNLSVSGNLSYVDVETSITSNLLWVAAGNATSAAAASGAGLAVGNVAAGTTYAKFTYDEPANVWLSNIGISAVGGVKAANIMTSGEISATGNITAVGNVYADYLYGNGFYISDLNAANLVGAYSNANVLNYFNSGNVDLAIKTGNIISVAGDITSATNVLSGNVSASGNVTAVGNVLAGNVSMSGNVIAANAVISANASVTGNVVAVEDIIGNNFSAGNVISAPVGSITTLTSTTVNYTTLATSGSSKQTTIVTPVVASANTFVTIPAARGIDYCWVMEADDSSVSMGRGFVSANTTAISIMNYGLASVGSNTVLYPTITGNIGNVDFSFDFAPIADGGNLILTTTQYLP